MINSEETVPEVVQETVEEIVLETIQDRIDNLVAEVSNTCMEDVRFAQVYDFVKREAPWVESTETNPLDDLLYGISIVIQQNRDMTEKLKKIGEKVNSALTANSEGFTSPNC